MPNENGVVPPHELGSIKAMLFCSWNIRSIMKHFDEVKRFLIVSKTDILVLVETFLDDQIDDRQLAIDGFYFYRCDRQASSAKATGGGIII